MAEKLSATKSKRVNERMNDAWGLLEKISIRHSLSEKVQGEWKGK